MAEKNSEEHLKLPVNVVSRTDVGRLVREVAALDDFLKQNALREPGKQPKLPKTSRMLDEFLSLNELNALHEDDRHRLYMFLQTIKERAPVLHMSFAADPSPRFQQQLMSWLRVNVDSMVLVQLGLQPNIGAGLVMRTNNKFFDLSLRDYFKSKRSLLVEKIHGTEEEAAKEKEEIVKEQALLEQEKAPSAEAPAPQPAQPAVQAEDTKVPEDSAPQIVKHSAEPVQPSAPQPATAPETPVPAAPAAAVPVPVPVPAPAPAPVPVNSAPTPAPVTASTPSAPPIPAPEAQTAPEPAPSAPPANYQPPKPLVGHHSEGGK